MVSGQAELYKYLSQKNKTNKRKGPAKELNSQRHPPPNLTIRILALGPEWRREQLPKLACDLHTGMKKMHKSEETGREMPLIPALKRQKRAEVGASQGYTERPASKRKVTERNKIIHSKFGVKSRQLLARLTLL